MASRCSGFFDQIEMELVDARENLLHFSTSSLYQTELLNVLTETEQILSKVEESPPESINRAVRTIFEALIAKELLRHPDVDVNILVACCICEILRIVGAQPFYTDEQLTFFESVVMIFEKLISAPGGCGLEMDRFLKKFASVRLPVMMLRLQLDGLVVKLFSHILSIADDEKLRLHYSGLVYGMETIMTMFIEESEEINMEVVGILITSVRLRKDNQTAIPVCWQLAEQVIKNCANKLKPHLPDMVQDKVAEETITCKTEGIELTNDTNHNIQVECLEKSRNMAMSNCNHSEDEKKQEKKAVSFSDDPPESVTEVKKKRKRNNSLWKKQVAEETITFKTEGIELTNDTDHNIQVECSEKSRNMAVSKCNHSEDEKKHEKKTVSFSDDPPESVTEVKKKRKRNNGLWKKQAQSVDHGENLVGSRIKVWCPLRKIYEKGVVKSFDCGLKKHKVLYDDGDEELVDLKGERWKLYENVFAIPDTVGNDSSHESGIICVQGYKVKQSCAQILEAVFNKHGDIAANCVFKTSSTRTYFLEVVCEIVRCIQTNDVIEIMKDIESQLLDVEVANINVSWIRAHIEAFHKRNEAWMLLETKANITLVKKLAQRDLERRSAKLAAAKERFEKADKCMQVLHLVEKKLNDNSLDTKDAKDLWVKQPLL